MEGTEAAAFCAIGGSASGCVTPLSTCPAHAIDRQIQRGHRESGARQWAEVYLSVAFQEEVDHLATRLADEMVVVADFRVVTGDPLAKQDGADFSILDQSLKVAIDSGETDPRELFAHPPIDLISEGMSRVTLESLIHCFELTRRSFVERSPHMIPQRTGLPGGMDSATAASEHSVLLQP